ncbi:MULTISPECIES: hypothetical protein [Bacteroidales]|uniref:hypothetical protein n=1 Tax=Bacteroidales TaxID=171549 RepID=UPI000ACCBB39|nr:MULTISPECIES: hypothetical protein [Bacteroidaceae]MCE8434564.1 hypothetical protein [Phocaeicola dorei]MCE8447620.1 hypothetical protein [Phocaeicola dorei]MCE8824284.1 hypothetical protein [Phocaeicola dorei]MCE8832681.1 hypothetical protein [Phocaeicola dorei]MCE8860351.1 hypothetical protein [Phocaeicola vulgatus]
MGRRSPAVYDMTETGASDGTKARRMCLFLCAAITGTDRSIDTRTARPNFIMT